MSITINKLIISTIKCICSYHYIISVISFLSVLFMYSSPVTPSSCRPVALSPCYLITQMQTMQWFKLLEPVWNKLVGSSMGIYLLYSPALKVAKQLQLLVYKKVSFLTFGTKAIFPANYYYLTCNLRPMKCQDLLPKASKLARKQFPISSTSNMQKKSLRSILKCCR